MIRPFTLVTMLLAAGSGAYLFGVKHHAQMLDDQIAEISQASRLDAQRIRVLQAQWALETDPTRLQLLASQFTDLQPMQPAQLVTLAALQTSLPPPGSPPPGPNPELPADAQPDVAPPDVAQMLASNDAAGGLPLPPPPQADAAASPQAPQAPPVRMASVDVPSRPSQIRQGRQVSHAPPAGTELAEVVPPPRPFAPPPLRPFGTPSRRPFAPRAVSASALAPVEAPAWRSVPLGAQIVSVKASAPIAAYAPDTPVASADNSGSALGMAAALPPPQPLQSGLGN